MHFSAAWLTGRGSGRRRGGPSSPCRMVDVQAQAGLGGLHEQEDC